MLLLLIVAACVVALIVISKKRRALEESVPPVVVSDAGAGLPAEETEEVIDEQDSSQVTIYAYRAVNKMRLCPLCDGENGTSATHCHVCGQKLN